MSNSGQAVSIEVVKTNSPINDDNEGVVLLSIPGNGSIDERVQ